MSSVSVGGIWCRKCVAWHVYITVCVAPGDVSTHTFTPAGARERADDMDDVDPAIAEAIRRSADSVEDRNKPKH